MIDSSYSLVVVRQSLQNSCINMYQAKESFLKIKLKLNWGNGNLSTLSLILDFRRKAFNSVLEIESVKNLLSAIALSHPSITITLRDESSGEKLLQTYPTDNFGEAFLNISMDTGLTLKDLIQISADDGGSWSLSGFIGSPAFSNNSKQFVFVNNR